MRPSRRSAFAEIAEAVGNLSKGLSALKEAWSFSNRMAALQKKYANKAAPVGELFAEMLGFGDKPNPLELVEKQLAEINTKLDRVLAGIEDLKLGQLGHGVLVAYLDISDPVYLIDKYSQDLASYHDTSAIGASGGDPGKMTIKLNKVAEKYKGWMKAIVENSFLPFAERVATLRFNDEYLGGHDTKANANYLHTGWKPAKLPILQSADELAAKLLGRSKSVTLRVVANVPPVATTVPSKDDSGAAGAAGTYEWRFGGGTPTSLNRENILDKLEPGGEHLFKLYSNNGHVRFSAESVRKVEIPFAEAAELPVGYDKRRLSLLRYQFDLGNMNGPGFQFEYDYGVGQKRGLPARFETKWERWHYDTKWVRYSDKNITYFLLTDVDPVKFPGYFQLPSDGQLSPVLVTYAYEKFGPA